MRTQLIFRGLLMPKFKNSIPTTKQKLSPSTPIHIGILGAGQLARMMVLEAHRLGIATTVFGYSSQDPAALVTQSFQLLCPTDKRIFTNKQLQSIKKLTHLTFESEFFNIQTLKKQLKSFKKLNIYPSLDNMEKLQYRDQQKRLLDLYKIPTANWLKLNTPHDWNQITQLFKPPFVFKKNHGGYDGNGTLISNQTSILPGQWIVEAFASFKRELAVTAFCHPQTGITFYPVVQTKQLNSRCDWVLGPTDHPQWPMVKKRIIKMLRAIQYQGVIAFELFDLGEEQLLVNEVAPRVHNSSHYTQNSYLINQFAAHLLCALPTTIKKNAPLATSFAMVNLIANPQYSMDLSMIENGHLHWYGKNLFAEGRKMGHINYSSNHLSPATLIRTALRERKKIFKES